MRYKTMDFLYHSSNTDVRIMHRDDIPIICKAGNDESKRNITYLENQLSNQDKQECRALIAFYNNEAAGHVFLYYKCRWDGLAIAGHCIPRLFLYPLFHTYALATSK